MRFHRSRVLRCPNWSAIFQRPPTVSIACLAVITVVLFLVAILHSDWQLFWTQHTFSVSALLDGKYSEMVSKTRPPSHALFPYKAYYDHLRNPPGYRIFGISKCLFDNTNVSIGIGNDLQHAETTMIVGSECPSPWIADYAWNSIEFSTTSDTRAASIELVVNKTRRVILPVTERPKVIQKGKVEVCVSAVYWYDDWPRLILFVELWRKVHNAHFTIYIQSISRNAQMVLDYYAKKGFLKIVAWPYLPTFPGTEDANKDVFRLAEVIGQNDCLLRSNAEIGVLMDIDEFAYVKNNQSLLEFMRKKGDEIQDLGAVKFRGIGIDMPVLDGNFEAIGQEYLTDRDLRKTAFFPERTLKIFHHDVQKFAGPYKQYLANKEEAVVAHARQNFFIKMNRKNNNNVKQADRLPFYTPEFRDTLLKRKEDIFGIPAPEYIPRRVVTVIDECFMRLYRDTPRKGFTYEPKRMIPIQCKEDVRNLDEWIEYENSGDSEFRIV